MPVSNTTAEILRSSPYFDDYDASKDFLQILTRPRFALQTREFNQGQTILQAQIERLGTHLFKNGSVVLGGELTYDDKVISVQINREFANTTVDLETLYAGDPGTGRIITGVTSGALARVTQIDPAESEEFAKLIVTYLGTTVFVAGETISYKDDDDNFVQVATIPGSGSPIGVASVVSINQGVYFINGFFVQVSPQTLILSSITNQPTGRVGLTVTESIITEDEDSSLRDPALGSSNYTAPGAHRLRIRLTLDVKELSSDTATDPIGRVADINFVELIRLQGGTIVQQQLIPFYAELEKTLARRTNDESGSYTVRPFTITVRENLSGNDELLSIGLQPGKAYVEGYEYETISTTFLDVPKSRETEAVSGFDIATPYGNYALISDVDGIFDTSSQELLDIHCVVASDINVSSAATYASTKIGTVRPAVIQFQQDSANGAPIYSLHVHDFRTTALTGNLAASSTNTAIRIPTGVGSLVTNAYYGATVTVVDTTGATATRDITSYLANSSVRELTVNSAIEGLSLNTLATFAINFNFKDAESVVLANSTPAVLKSANIAREGKIGGTANGDAFLSETDRAAFLWRIPQNFVKRDSLTDLDYETTRIFSGGLVSDVITIQTADSSERFHPGVGSLSASQVADHIIMTDANGSILEYGSNPGIVSVVINAVSNSSPGTMTITTQGVSDETVAIRARLNIDGATPKTKTLVSGNTTHAVGTLVSGQVAIAAPNRVRGDFDALGISDIYRIVKVVDSLAIGSAVSNTMVANSDHDVTSRYTLDNGQRDNLYDHGRIQLNASATPPSGQLLVIVDYFNHSGNGFCSVDSYINLEYEDIPSYTSPSTGAHFELRDALDFRPVRAHNSNTAPDFTIENIQVPHPDSTFEADYEYFMSRIDKIILTRDRQFKLIQGIPGINPQVPSDEEGMVLYTIALPPYTFTPTDVRVRFHENKRYTMRDIGRLERRIESIEYYTSLNLLEKAARDQAIFDANDLELFKNGILVDPFGGHSIGDVRDPDYRCAIDPEQRSMRPRFVSDAWPFSFTANSINSNITKTGDVITLPYTETVFVDQPLASGWTNINPFQVHFYIGQLTLWPEIDSWRDQTVLPDVVINQQGENDNYDPTANLDPTIAFGTRWNDWATTWYGSQVIDSQIEADGPKYFEYPGDPSNGNDGGWVQKQVRRDTIETTQKQVRTGVTTKLVPETITTKIGTRSVDQSTAPYIRANTVIFTCEGLQPGQTFYAFFDTTEVTRFIERANELVLTDSTAFNDDPGTFEYVTSDAGGTARVIKATGNVLKIVETGANGRFLHSNSAQTPITGNTSGLTSNVVSYTHWSGVLAAASNVSVTLSEGASSNNDFYNGLTISILTGDGLGVQGTITDYNGTTKVANVELSTVPSGTPRYSIGPLVSDDIDDAPRIAGGLYGAFHLPNTSAYRFLSGNRRFRLTDSPTNTPSGTGSSADATYRSAGLFTTVEQVFSSTRAMVLRSVQVSEERIITNRTVQSSSGTVPVSYHDPVAETFLVDVGTYPNGLFLTSVDLFFRAKDSTGIPVTVQIRPVYNGYPSASGILPFGEVTLNPEDVATSETPDPADANTATRATFSSPIYLSPGQEYAVVLLSNSLEYEVFTARVGANQLNTNRTISAQPYLGSFFKSQNSSTWTPVQEEDLMFRLNRAVFSLSGTAQFSVPAPAANTEYDVLYLNDGALVNSNTALAFGYKSANSTGLASAFTSFVAGRNIAQGDRKTVYSTGNTVVLQASLSTNDPAVSPTIDMQRLSLITVRNYVDNGGLSVDRVFIANTGSGYTPSSNVTLTITGGGGSGASGVATVNSSGNIANVTITAEGSGYVTSPTITISGNGSITYLGEDKNAGGHANTRYITRRVTLADGFDASDLRVYFGAVKPIGTEVDVYYKVLAADDPQSFDTKTWHAMSQDTNLGVFSKNDYDVKDYSYRTTGNTAGYAVGTTVYDRFKTFAIKIVLRSSVSTVVPILRDLRVIAVDA